MQAPSKLQLLKQAKLRKDQEYKVTIDIERILKQVQDDNIKYKKQKLNINQKQFITLCRRGRNLLLSQPSLLKINGQIIVATGTIGYFKHLVHIINRCESPAFANYLFLGDYVGKGDKNIQCLVLLICLKIKFPNNFFLLRGCMDSIALTRSYNFYDQCLERLSSKAWSQACQFLCSLPFAAVIQNQIFCCHGGISPQLRSVQQINKITRPLETPQVGLICDLIWADPSYKQDSLIWSKSQRGFSFTFNQTAVQVFLKQNKLSMICRAHEVVYDGFRFNKEKTLGTICSLANYGGLFNNSAAVFVLNPQGQAYFKVIKQRQHFPMPNLFSDNASSLLKKVMQQKRQKKRQLQRQFNLKQIEYKPIQKNQKQKKLVDIKKTQNLVKISQEKKQNQEQQILEKGSSDQPTHVLDEEQMFKIKVLKGQVQIISNFDTNNCDSEQSDQDRL